MVVSDAHLDFVHPEVLKEHWEVNVLVHVVLLLDRGQVLLEVPGTV